eukprot:m.14427 g.14427  ORF g.14427 m.14427 type:complete len:129 (+) comp4309_c0_seq1:311-697(+)
MSFVHSEKSVSAIGTDVIKSYRAVFNHQGVISEENKAFIKSCEGHLMQISEHCGEVEKYSLKAWEHTIPELTSIQSPIETILAQIHETKDKINSIQSEVEESQKKRLEKHETNLKEWEEVIGQLEVSQ